MRSWIGTSGFQYSEWKGSFYPETLPTKKMLPFYAEQFATTEINYSFRRIPSPKTISDWRNATPPTFKFTFKAPQKITHFARLRDCTDTLDYFVGIISELDAQLGVVLFQLPPDFSKNTELLKFFLEQLPPGLRAAFEFRNRSWFEEDVFAALRDHNASLCIADSERLTTPSEVTADFGYLRLRRGSYDAGDIARWAAFIRAQTDRWRDVFVYFKHEEAGTGPRLAREMMVALE